jgi:hypothetical protein
MPTRAEIKHHATLLLIDAEWAQLQFEHLGVRGWWKRRTAKQVWITVVSVIVLFGCVLYDQATSSLRSPEPHED